MSPLPKKKKTPEELAALRESLGIPPEGPSVGAPGLMGPGPQAPAPLPELKAGPKKEVPQEVPETVEKIAPKEFQEKEQAVVLENKEAFVSKPVVLEAEELPEVKAKPMRSLRKSERLPVDKPKKVAAKESGKLPTRRHREGERIPLEKPTQAISGGTSNLPTHKHSDQELARLRHAPLPGLEPPAVHLANQTMGVLGLVSIYGLGLILLLIAGAGAVAAKAPRFDLPFEWLQDAVALPSFSMIVYGIMCGGVAVMLLGAAWIFFKKPISQHHSAILTIIAVLVLVFGTLYFFPGLHGA